jgi:outer membrane protein
MKKIILFVLVCFITIGNAHAQRFAYVDTDAILKKMPEYNAAQKQLDDQAASWQTQLEEMYKEIDQLYKAFQAEQVLLTEDVKKQREEEIVNKEKDAKAFQKKKFGFEGDLFKKRQELVRPIQDRVYNAVKKLAEVKSLDFIFDKAAQGNMMLFSNSKYDRTDEVMTDLGITK